MPSAKRTTLATGSPMKKAKKDPLVAKFGLIETAIQRAESAGLPSLTATAAAALVAAVPHSLGQAKAQRHKFQEEAVQMTGQILEDYKASLEEQLKACGAKVVEAQNRCSELQAVIEQRQSEADAARAKAQDLKVALAADARTFQEAKAALNETERLAAEGRNEFKATAGKKEEVEKLQKEMEHLHEDGSSGLKNFATRMERFVEVDSSMMTAIPCVLSKEPSSRGQFDLMVVQQLAEKVQRTITKLNETIEGGATAEVERAAAVQAAKDAFLQAREKQVDAARAYMAAADAAKIADEDVQKMRSEAGQAKKKVKDATEAQTEVQVDIDIFSDQVLNTFAELRDRTATADDTLIDVVDSPSSNVAAGLSPSAAAVPAAVEVAA